MKRASIYGLVLVQALGGALAACGSGSGREGAGQDTGSVSEVSLSLTALPSGVACLQVIASSGGTTLATQTFTAVANWTGTVGLGATFSKGTVTVAANAYNAACTAISGTTPTWIADSTSVDVTPGKQNPVTLNFRQNFGVAATGNFAPTVVDIAAGQDSSGVIFADGTVKVFGSIAQPTGLTGVAELALGTSHACARKTDGTVWCWGSNDHGELGNGTTTASLTTPVKATGISAATAIVAGASDSCAITGPSGTVFCWGRDGSYQLGDATTTDKLTPMNGLSFDYAAKLSLNQDAMCYVQGSTLQGLCTGDNLYGQLGNGSTGNAFPGSYIAIQAPLTSIATAGPHVCASDVTGHVYCWGYNGSGELGLNTFTNANVATLVPSLSAIAEVTVTYNSTCARSSTGAVSCWGNNGVGTVGDGTDVNQPAPVAIPLPTASRKIRGGGFHFCSLQNDGAVMCWGYNYYGQLGDGTNITSVKPLAMKL